MKPKPKTPRINCSVEVIRKLISYDPHTGKLWWLKRSADLFPTQRAAHAWNMQHAGKEAFTAIDNFGYKRGRIFGKNYSAHRVVMALTTGEFPPAQVDHMNGVRTDNRRSNLRLATCSDNSMNRRIHHRNKSGKSGVCWISEKKKWRAYICSNGKRSLLGYFKDMAEAIKARTKAEVLAGFHKNHGRKS
jgi:hypothetical protein